MQSIEATTEDKILPTISRLAHNYNMTFTSLLDVGSSDRPLVDWFYKFRFAREPFRYLAVEVDPHQVAKLIERNLQVVDRIPNGEEFDLTLALEVLEHIRPEQSLAFLRQCARATNKLFALTTPNFEYWQKFRPRPEYKECRWLPDHVTAFKPGSSDPHAHQQEITPESLHEYMILAFPPPEWEVSVIRAWPWLLQDESRANQYHLYFKLFATARRKP